MSRWSKLVAAVAACIVVSLASSAAAVAQGPTAGFAIGHDDTLDPGDVQSGFFQLLPFDTSLQPDAQRTDMALFLDANYDNTGTSGTPPGTTRGNNNFTVPADPGTPTDNTGWSWEKRRFVIAPGDVNGSFAVTIRWASAELDFDLAVYRERGDGTLDPTPIATSAQGGTTEETATVVPDRVDTPVAPGAYWVYVDNWCTADDDLLDLEVIEDFGADLEQCAPSPAAEADGDDWLGEVTFSPLVLQNKKPVVGGIAGPTSANTGQTLSYTVNASDADGTIQNYAFDLDGDGRFEYDNGLSNVVATRYDTAGVRNLGVRVLDDRGGVTYGSISVSIVGAAQPGGKTAPGLVKAFRLNRPVFGGTRKRSLRLAYSVRENARVTISLYRGKKRVKRLVRDRPRVAGRVYRLTIRSKGKKRGTYTLRMRAVGADGKTQRARLTATRL